MHISTLSNLKWLTLTPFSMPRLHDAVRAGDYYSAEICMKSGDDSKCQDEYVGGGGAYNVY